MSLAQDLMARIWDATPAPRPPAAPDGDASPAPAPVSHPAHPEPPTSVTAPAISLLCDTAHHYDCPQCRCACHPEGTT